MPLHWQEYWYFLFTMGTTGLVQSLEKIDCSPLWNDLKTLICDIFLSQFLSLLSPHGGGEHCCHRTQLPTLIPSARSSVIVLSGLSWKGKLRNRKLINAIRATLSLCWLFLDFCICAQLDINHNQNHKSLKKSYTHSICDFWLWEKFGLLVDLGRGIFFLTSKKS